jgi:triosephosphate isomerase
MNLDRMGIERFFSRFSLDNAALEQCRVVVCPTYVYLEKVKAMIGDKELALGAQNIFSEEKGAYTGEVAARQLADAGCRYVILGHSERRRYFGENDQLVNSKIKLALKNNLFPVLCLGENYQEKEDGLTKKVIESSLRACLDGLNSFQVKKVIIAYEPVWAISTSPENVAGVADSPEAAQVVHKFIKRVVADLADEHVAEAMTVIYGGSVTPENIQGFAAMDDINGVLVGGASQEADSFVKIINAFIK